MIEIIKGTVASKGEKSLTLMVGGIGLRIWTTNRILANIKVGDLTRLETDLILRETEISLYGFEEDRERDMFRTLLKVNGIGPKAGLAILSTLPIKEIYRAIQAKDYKYFTSVPGIGTKTAQKLILYLQDSIDFGEEDGMDPTVATIHSDLLEALVALGYSVVEAQSAIQSIPQDTPEDLEDRLRAALQHFM